MFYGTINSDGSVDTSKAFSNNFTVSVSSNVYTLTFEGYLHYPPTVTATAIGSNTSKNNYVAVQTSMTQTTVGSPFKAKFWVWKAGHDDPVSHGFTFHARAGQTLLFDASKNTTLSLVPHIIDFDGQLVLAASTSIAGLDSSAQSGSGHYSAYLDKGTVLHGVYPGGGDLTLSIPLTTTDPSGSRWNLSGWTFGGSSGTTGTQWSVGQSSSTWTLSVPVSRDGAPVSPMTTPESFVIMATKDDQTLTTDPVVRLSSVPPGGISL